VIFVANGVGDGCVRGSERQVGLAWAKGEPAGVATGRARICKRHRDSGRQDKNGCEERVHVDEDLRA
jgi:hypothetical protein